MPILSEEQILNLKSSIAPKVGNAIKLARKKRNISQIVLAQRTHKDRQYIYKIEKGIVTPNIVTLCILAVALEVSISELLEDI